MKFKPCLAEPEFTSGKDNFFCSQPIILQKNMSGRRDDYGFGGMNVMFGGMNADWPFRPYFTDSVRILTLYGSVLAENPY